MRNTQQDLTGSPVTLDAAPKVDDFQHYMAQAIQLVDPSDDSARAKAVELLCEQIDLLRHAHADLISDRYRLHRRDIAGSEIVCL